MQTFLPYANYQKCAEVLDDKRLWKQIVECKQIFIALADGDDSKSKWKNHPAVLMWKGYEPSLYEYLDEMVMEYSRRKNLLPLPLQNPAYKILDWASKYYSAHEEPPWLGDARLHSSHIIALLIKKPEHYNKFFIRERCSQPENVQYFWPSKCVDYGGEGDGYIPGVYVQRKEKNVEKDKHTVKIIVKIKDGKAEVEYR